GSLQGGLPEAGQLYFEEVHRLHLVRTRLPLRRHPHLSPGRPARRVEAGGAVVVRAGAAGQSQPLRLAVADDDSVLQPAREAFARGDFRTAGERLRKLVADTAIAATVRAEAEQELRDLRFDPVALGLGLVSLLVLLVTAFRTMGHP